jgi:Uncharacterised nucleotidyltransferase
LNEAAFVVWCAREPGRRPAGSLAALAASVRRWDRVVALADRSRMTAYVHRAVAEAGCAVPPAAGDELARRRLEAAARTLLVAAELAEALAVLRGAGVPFLVLKGPALARTVYGDASLRPYDDVDLAVRGADLPPAVAALRAAGWTVCDDPRDDAWRLAAGRVRHGAGFHRVLRSPRGPHVELHTDVLAMGLSPLCEDARWARARPLPGLAGALALDPADQVVALAVHAHKHGFERLLWLKDLDLLAGGDRVDWDLVVATARREGVAGSVWYALELCRRLLGTPVDRRLLRRLAPAPPLRLLYRAVWPVRSVAGLEARMRRRAVQLVAVESWRGVLPNLLLMGRRRDRAVAAWDYLRLVRGD